MSPPSHRRPAPEQRPGLNAPLQTKIGLCFRDRRAVQIPVRAEPPVVNDAALTVEIRDSGAAVTLDELVDCLEVRCRQLAPIACSQRVGKD